MKLIDLENHFYDTAAIEALKTRKGYPFFDTEEMVMRTNAKIAMPFGKMREILTDFGEGRLSIFDRCGVTTAVISHSQAVEEVDPSESIALAQHSNDTLYRVAQENPGRDIGSAILPVKDTDAACRELRRCVKELGFVAWHTHSNYMDSDPSEERFIPIFETAAELGVYVYLHPTFPDYAGMDDFGFTFAGPAAGYTIDAMLTTLKMIVNGLFDRVPGTKLVLGHLGEAIPFLLDRIDNRLNYTPNPRIKNLRKPSDYFRDNIYVTVSGNMCDASFRCTKDVLGIDKIMFGSDYPYENIEAMADFVRALDITEEERELLFFRNAERLLYPEKQ